MMVASLLCGWLIDRLPSRRAPFIFGLLSLDSSTILLCLGSSIALLVLGRLLEGFSAAITWTAGPTLVVDTVGRKKIGRAMGWITISINGLPAKKRRQTRAQG